MDRNTYSIDELVVIFKACANLEEVYKACRCFEYLIRHDLQQRSEALQAIPLERLREIL